MNVEISKEDQSTLQKLELWINNERGYLECLIAYPYSYVLNLRKGSGESQPALHRAWCPTIRRRKSTDRDNPFTGRGYKKVAAPSIRKLEDWLKDDGRQKKSFDECSTCKPYDENFIAREIPGREILDELFQIELRKSSELSEKDRRKRLKYANPKSRRIKVDSYSYYRNPDVVVEVLKRASGICEICGKPAPFIRKKDRTPFLEVHHKTPLSNNGDDTVENCVAACPNCHREKHFG